MRKWFDKLSAVGSFLSNALTLLTSGWGVALSAALAVAAWLSGHAAAIVNNSEIKAAVLIFVFLLWSYIGIDTVVTRNKPRPMKRVASLDYGLAVEDISPIFVPQSEFSLQFIISVRNVSGEPIEYRIKSFDTYLKSRHSAVDAEKIGAISFRLGSGCHFGLSLTRKTKSRICMGRSTKEGLSRSLNMVSAEKDLVV